MLKVIIFNLFQKVKKILLNILNDPMNFLYDRYHTHNCIIEIINLLSETLSKFETIYFEYILKPKLDQFNYIEGS